MNILRSAGFKMSKVQRDQSDWYIKAIKLNDTTYTVVEPAQPLVSLGELTKIPGQFGWFILKFPQGYVNSPVEYMRWNGNLWEKPYPILQFTWASSVGPWLWFTFKDWRTDYTADSGLDAAPTMMFLLHQGGDSPTFPAEVQAKIDVGEINLWEGFVTFPASANAVAVAFDAMFTSFNELHVSGGNPNFNYLRFIRRNDAKTEYDLTGGRSNPVAVIEYQAMGTCTVGFNH